MGIHKGNQCTLKDGFHIEKKLPITSAGYLYQISKYKLHRIPKLKWFSSRLAVVLAQFIEARYEVEIEDVVGAAPTGNAPTASEWSTILLPT